MLADLGFWSWTAILLLLAAILLVWWLGRRLGQRARQDFYRMIDADIRQLLQSSGCFTPAEIEQMVCELKTPSAPLSSLAVLRIDYTLSCKDTSSVCRTVAVAYMDQNNLPVTNQVERRYDWDFIPDDLGDALILSIDQSINIPVYVKKNVGDR